MSLTAVRRKISNDHELFNVGKVSQSPAATTATTSAAAATATNNYLNVINQSCDFDGDESSISSLWDISSMTNSRWDRRHIRRTCLYCCRKESAKEIGGGGSVNGDISYGGGGGGSTVNYTSRRNTSDDATAASDIGSVGRFNYALRRMSSDDTTIATGGGSSSGGGGGGALAADRVAASILRHVQRMANPVWSKQSKMALLELKQKNPSVFQDICLYSEICLALSRNTYQLYARRFLQELFLDLDFECLIAETQSVGAAALQAAGLNASDLLDPNTSAAGRLMQQQNGGGGGGGGRPWLDINGVVDLTKSSANAAQLASVFETSAENLDNESRGLIVVIEIQKLVPTEIKSTTRTNDYKSPITAMPPPPLQLLSSAVAAVAAISSSLTTRRLPSELLPTEHWQYDVDTNTFRHGEFVYAGCEYTAWGDQLSRRVPLTGWIYDCEKLQFRKATTTATTSPNGGHEDDATTNAARRCWRPISSISSNTSSGGGSGGGGGSGSGYTKGSSFSGGTASDDVMTGGSGGGVQAGQERRMRPRFNTLELDLSCTKNRFPIGERRRTIEQLIHNGGPADVRAKLPRDDWTYVAKCDVFVHKNVQN